MEKCIAAALFLTFIAIGFAFIIGETLIHRHPEHRNETKKPESSALPPKPMEPAALAVLEAFFEAPDLESKAAFIRDSERVKPLMENYHQARGHPFPTLSRVSPGRAARFHDAPVVLFEVEPFSGPRFPIAVVWDGKRFAVDWESLTAYGTIDWSEFVERRPTSPQTLRVFVQNVAKRLQHSASPDGYTTFQIEHRDHPQPLIAVANAEVARTLKPLVEGKRLPATLEITWKPVDSTATLVPEITELKAPTWSR